MFVSNSVSPNVSMVLGDHEFPAPRHSNLLPPMILQLTVIDTCALMCHAPKVYKISLKNF